MAAARRLAAALAFGLLLSGPAAASEAVSPLSSYNIDMSAISVSGISSGGFMAVQYHVAHSAQVMGAGVVAGGPFYCAQDSVMTAISRCMPGDPSPPSADTLQLVTNAVASGGDIDPTANLHGDRVFLFSGTHDDVVATSVMESLKTYYEGYIADEDIVFVDTVDAPHSFVTDHGSADASQPPSLTDSPQTCFPSCPDMMQCINVCLAPNQGDCPTNPCLADNQCTYVNDCGYDTAQAILSHIYGSLQPAAEADRSNLVAFSQADFVSDPASIGLGETGYLYVPADCRSGDTACRLHVAFHGCLQGADRIGDAFYWGAGYNRWAEANDIVMLYPQAVGSSTPQQYNPMGCWDWWGFTGPYYPRKEGHQVRAVYGMVQRVVGAQAVD